MKALTPVSAKGALITRFSISIDVQIRTEGLFKVQQKIENIFHQTNGRKLEWIQPYIS